jgi:predicted RNA-binding protein with PIN domain
MTRFKPDYSKMKFNDQEKQFFQNLKKNYTDEELTQEEWIERYTKKLKNLLFCPNFLKVAGEYIEKRKQDFKEQEREKYIELNNLTKKTN